MHALIVDGHPAPGRLLTALLDGYAAALPAGTKVTRLAIRDLAFASNLRQGYVEDQPWESDLQTAAAAINDCDHLVIGFPLWWGAEPALLKGFLDRILLPGFAFRYHKQDVFWDRLLSGRSADVIITMDTPPWYLRAIYRDPVGHRWRRQILGFCGFAPIRIYRLGPTRRGEAGKRMAAWEAKLAQAAKSATALKRKAKSAMRSGRAEFGAATAERKS